MEPNSINNSQRDTSARFTSATNLWKMIYCTIFSELSQYNKRVFTELHHIFPGNLSTHSGHIKYLFTVLAVIGLYNHTWERAPGTLTYHFTEEAERALFQHCVLYQTRRGQQGNRGMCGCLSFKAKVSVWKATKSTRKSFFQKVLILSLSEDRMFSSPGSLFLQLRWT